LTHFNQGFGERKKEEWWNVQNQNQNELGNSKGEKKKSKKFLKRLQGPKGMCCTGKEKRGS